MNVLLAYASRYGSTREIAEAIVEELRRGGHETDLMDVRDVDDLTGYDAVVLGSAIYIGQWMDTARAFVDRFELELRGRRVWLFTSGPIGEEPLPVEEPAETSGMIRRTESAGHVSFLGKLDRSQLRIADRIVSKVVRAPEGDFREWQEIRGWARDVASALSEVGEPLSEAV